MSKKIYNVPDYIHLSNNHYQNQESRIMKIINKHFNSTIIATAVTLLQAAIPELTPTSLIAAIKAFEKDKTSSTEHSKRLYRISEVCKILIVSRQSIYNLIASGRLKRVHVPAPRVTGKSLEKLLQGGT